MLDGVLKGQGFDKVCVVGDVTVRQSRMSWAVHVTPWMTCLVAIFNSPLPVHLSTMAASEKSFKGKVDILADQNTDSVDSDVRYMAYGSRLRTALRASTRYIAY